LSTPTGFLSAWFASRLSYSRSGDQALWSSAS
jgi:hypothetical protein